MLHIYLSGWSSSLPPYCYSNEEWARHFNVDESTAARYGDLTGVRRRHSVVDFEGGRRQKVLVETLAAEAGAAAIERAGILPREVDCVVAASMQFDYFLPAISSRVLKRLGIADALTFDLYGGCAQFMQGLHLAMSLLRARAATTVLVTGAEATTSFLRQVRYPVDAFIFGDGGGAWVLTTRPPRGRGSSPVLEVCDSMAQTVASHQGEATEIIVQPIVGPFKEPFDSFLDDHDVDDRMLDLSPNEPVESRWSNRPRLARRVASFGVAEGFHQMTKGLSLENGVLIPHQGSRPVLQDVSELVPDGWSMVDNLENRGNLSTACIPVAFDEHFEKCAAAENIVAVSVGVGFSYAAARIRRVG